MLVKLHSRFLSSSSFSSCISSSSISSRLSDCFSRIMIGSPETVLTRCQTGSAFCILMSDQRPYNQRGSYNFFCFSFRFASRAFCVVSSNSTIISVGFIEPVSLEKLRSGWSTNHVKLNKRKVFITRLRIGPMRYHRRSTSNIWFVFGYNEIFSQTKRVQNRSALIHESTQIHYRIKPYFC